MRERGRLDAGAAAGGIRTCVDACRHASALAATFLRFLAARPGSAIILATSTALSVGVFVTILAMAEGIRERFSPTVDDRRALVLHSETWRGEAFGSFNARQMRTLTDSLTNSPTNSPKFVDASAERIKVFWGAPARDGDAYRATMRGVGPAAFRIRPEVRIASGRWFEPGRFEIAVGTSAAQILAGLEIGDVFADPTRPAVKWTVVGHFEAGGGLHETEIWADAEAMGDAYDKNFNSLWLQLPPDGDALARARKLLESIPNAPARIIPEAEAFRARSERVVGPLRTFGIIAVALMVIGAGASSLNAGYTAVTARRRELAVLSAMGFRGSAIGIGLAIEMLAAALAGGVLGATAAWLLADGAGMAAGGQQLRFTYDLAVTLPNIAAAMAIAMAIGTLGAVLAGLLALRGSIAAALAAH